MAGGGKVSPRQKMINMMYLVLTALLALNVSKEIIKAFNLFENSLMSATKNTVAKNKVIMSALESQVKDNNQQAVTAQKYASEVSAIADKFVGMIEDSKKEIETRAGGRSADPEKLLIKGGVAEVEKGDDMEGHADYFLHLPNEKNNNGQRIQDAVGKAREEMLAVIDKAIAAGLSPNTLRSKKANLAAETSLRAEDQASTDGKQLKWYNMFLVETPASSVLAMLTKLQNDARTLESEINGQLASAVGAEDFKFDALEAVVSSPSSAILRGETYEADIILAAYSSTANMSISVNGASVPVEAGKGKLKRAGGAAGEYSYKVKIAVPNPAGGQQIVEGEGKYSVFEPAASISADKLDMLYIGLDNPMSITVAGVDPKKVQASASGVRLVPAGGGKYKALASTPGNATVSVSATVQGRTVPMGKRTFRVRPVPNPVFKAGAVKFDQATVSLVSLRNQPAAAAVLENFIYEGVGFKVVGYQFTCIGQRTNGPKDVKSNSASLAGIKALLDKLRPGDFIQFTGIKVVGPDGKIRPIANVGAQVQ